MKKDIIVYFMLLSPLLLGSTSCANRVQATKTEHPSGRSVVEDHEDTAGRKEAARHFMVAQNLLKAGDLDNAENEINKVLSMAPDQPVPHLLAGDIYSAKGDFAKALKEYERAKDEDKTKAFPYAKIGEACVKLNMKDKALEAFQSAVRLDPNVPALHKRLGDLYKDTGMEAEARAEYGRAAELEKSRRESASGEGPEVSTAKAGKNPEPGDSPVVRVMKLGDEFLKQELWDLAADEYAIAVRLEPQNPIVHQKLGDAFQRKGMLTEAAGQYEEVIRLKPDLPLGYLGLGAVRSRMFKVKEAISLFQKGLSFAPDFSLLHFELAMAYTKEDNLDQAIPELEKAVSLDKERRPQPREILNRLIQEKAAEKGFVTMRSELFVLKYDPSEKKSFIDYTLKALHEAGKKLEKDMAYKLEEEVIVKLYPDIRAFHGAASTPDWFFGGVASAKNNMVMLATPKREVNIEKFPGVVTHELTHVFTNLITYGNHPGWLHEGLAQYEAGQWDGIKESVLRKALLERTLLRLDALNRPFSEFKNPEITTLAYAESYAAVKFILERYGRERLLQALKAFSAGKNFDQAAVGAFGIDSKTFENRWIEFLKQSYGA